MTKLIGLTKSLGLVKHKQKAEFIVSESCCTKYSKHCSNLLFSSDKRKRKKEETGKYQNVGEPHMRSSVWKSYWPSLYSSLWRWHSPWMQLLSTSISLQEGSDRYTQILFGSVVIWRLLGDFMDTVPVRGLCCPLLFFGGPGSALRFGWLLSRRRGQQNRAKSLQTDTSSKRGVSQSSLSELRCYGFNLIQVRILIDNELSNSSMNLLLQLLPRRVHSFTVNFVRTRQKHINIAALDFCLFCLYTATSCGDMWKLQLSHLLAESNLIFHLSSQFPLNFLFFNYASCKNNFSPHYYFV